MYISSYYTKHLAKLSKDSVLNADMKPLQAELKRIYRKKFGVSHGYSTMMYNS